MATAARTSSDDSRVLWREYRRTGDRALRNRLVLAYAPLVKAVAYRKVREMPPHTEVDDLVSCGLEALIHAIERYDPRRGATLEQYVWTRVNGAILDELRRRDWAPRSVRRWQRDIGRIVAEFTAIHDRAPRPAEIADALGLPLSELRRHERDIEQSGIASLNAPQATGGSGPGTARVDALVDDDPAVDPFAVVSAEASHERLVEVLEALPDREHDVAVLLYVQGRTMAQAGEALGISESRVSQLHRRLMAILRAALDDDRALFTGGPRR
jgi:RNA polymerase sigma factor for flagellar operon FliA